MTKRPSFLPPLSLPTTVLKFATGAFLIAQAQSAELGEELMQKIETIIEQKTQHLLELSLPSQNQQEDTFNLSLIRPYIGNIVQIKVALFTFNYEDEFEEEKSRGHLGTGFIYDATEGVICTNYHVLSNTFRGKVTVSLDDGSRYDDEDVEILGTSPGTAFGDYAFLRIKKIANTKPQMKMAVKHYTSVKRGDPVAFMGHSSGSFSIETGIVNDPYDFWTSGDSGPCSQSFKVQMDHRGGASGSPVFNNKAEVLGVLFAGDDTHAKICPISYVSRAYDELNRQNTISALTLGFPVKTIHISEITRLFDVPLEIISPYLSKNQDQGKKLLALLFSQKDFVRDNPLQQNDVILSVNGEPIGTDLLRLTAFLWNNETVILRILRGQDILDNIEVRPRRIVSTFMESLKISEENTIYSANSLYSHTNYLPPHVPLLVCQKQRVAPLCEIAITPVQTFREIAVALYKKIFEEKKRHFTYIMELTQTGKFLSSFDIPPLLTELYINRFNSTMHKWENITLKDYVNETEGGK